MTRRSELNAVAYPEILNILGDAGRVAIALLDVIAGLQDECDNHILQRTTVEMED